MSDSLSLDSGFFLQAGPSRPRYRASHRPKASSACRSRSRAPQALGLGEFEPAVLGFPVVEARLADPVLSAQVGRFDPGLVLFQNGDDLLFSMPLALHRAIAIESKRTIEIDEFVPKEEIDELYLNTPYYLVPDGEVGQQAFAVIRDAIRKVGMVALGRVVFTSREHVIPLKPRGKGLLGVTLRYPYEVRTEEEYFDDIPDEKIPKDMLELASHIVETKSGHFEPEQFEDQYEDALKELLKNRGLFQPGNPRLDYLLAAQVHERHAGIALEVRGNAADLAGAGDHLAFHRPGADKGRLPQVPGSTRSRSTARRRAPNADRSGTDCDT
jgi:Ku70/Ku80 beta-barrel domain